ncbi:MAG: hypothetical protein Q8P67_14040 [archaeon]|nr:hypothetical protein [archaeon]
MEVGRASIDNENDVDAAWRWIVQICTEIAAALADRAGADRGVSEGGGMERAAAAAE